MPVCASDWTWDGPAFPGSACRELDFSLIFSSVVLSILPSICFCFLAAHHIYKLSRKEIKINRSKASLLLCFAKLACAGLALLGSLVSLVGWVVAEDGGHATGTAAVALSVLASVGSRSPTTVKLIFDCQILAMLITYMEHFRRLRSSRRMSLFLVVLTCFDAARLRTFFLVNYDSTRTIFIAGFIIAFASRLPLLILENIPKRFILLDPNCKIALSDEAMAVPISRWTMFWLLRVLRQGYNTADLSLKDLGEVPQDSAAVYARFEKAWNRHQHQKLTMARALCSAFPGELMAPLVSVFLWCLLLMSVPLELAGLLKFLK